LQRTIAKEHQIRGVGLHTGRRVCLTLAPAPENHGILFIRGDLDGCPEIAAHVDNVVSTDLATTLGVGNATVATVEHLLSALSSLGIDNLKCIVEGVEIPILDGSAKQFIDQIKEVGVCDLKVPKRYLRIRDVIEVTDDKNTKIARVYPSSRFEVSCEIDFPHQLVGKQKFKYVRGMQHFGNEIAKARTFGFLHQVEALQRQGLALGGSLDNAVVLDKKGVINPEGLRYENELVRHKVLDAVGDIALLGYPVIGRFEMICAGHEIHRRLMKEILSKGAYEIVEASRYSDYSDEVKPLSMASA